jgi:thiosulfate/3-mercaptopyruvate sulfurtransferase
MEELESLYAHAGLEKETPVASYCAAGIRAANTYVVLKALGYDDVRNYAPSWGEWGTRPDTPVARHKP